MSEILKPCPFCGGEAEFSVGKTGDGKDWHYIECVDCSTVGPRVNYAEHNIRLKEALAEAWNGRTAKDAEPSLLADQNEWLKSRLAFLQLPPNQHHRREDWLVECGMPIGVFNAS